MKKILIADNQPVFVEGIRHILQKHFSFDMIDQTNDVNVLASKLALSEYDLILLDFEAFADTKIDFFQNSKNNSILIISSCRKTDQINKILKSPITGYITKESSVEELIIAVESSLKKEKFFCDFILDILLESNMKNKRGEVTVTLTQKEIEITNYISKGFTTKEIAEKLFVSHHTVNTHKKNIFLKLGINNTSELIMYAVKNGIVDLLEFSI